MGKYQCLAASRLVKSCSSSYLGLRKNKGMRDDLSSEYQDNTLGDLGVVGKKFNSLHGKRYVKQEDKAEK